MRRDAATFGGCGPCRHSGPLRRGAGRRTRPEPTVGVPAGRPDPGGPGAGRRGAAGDRNPTHTPRPSRRGRGRALKSTGGRRGHHRGPWWRSSPRSGWHRTWPNTEPSHSSPPVWHCLSPGARRSCRSLALLVAENGIAVAAVSVSRAVLPVVVELGVAFDLVLVVTVAIVFHDRIFGMFGTTDTRMLRGLRD